MRLARRGQEVRGVSTRERPAPDVVVDVRPDRGRELLQVLRRAALMVMRMVLATIDLGRVEQGAGIRPSPRPQPRCRRRRREVERVLRAVKVAPAHHGARPRGERGRPIGRTATGSRAAHGVGPGPRGRREQVRQGRRAVDGADVVFEGGLLLVVVDDLVERVEPLLVVGLVVRQH